MPGFVEASLLDITTTPDVSAGVPPMLEKVVVPFR